MRFATFTSKNLSHIKRGEHEYLPPERWPFPVPKAPVKMSDCRKIWKVSPATLGGVVIERLH